MMFKFEEERSWSRKWQSRDAMLVFQYAREQVDRIIAGTDNITLGDAHKEAERTRDGLNSAESKMKRLRELDPKLADLVLEK
jgi:hypothetical protein